MQRLELAGPDGHALRGELHQPPGRMPRRLPVVLLLHGLGSSRVEWYGFPAALAARGYSVVNFDFRGHGESDGLRGRQSIDRAFHDVESVLGGLQESYGVDVDRVALVGHSLGASIALHITPDMPDVRAVVAMAPPSRLANEMNPFERVGYFMAHVASHGVRLVSRRAWSVPYRVGYERLYASRQAVERARKDAFLQDWLPVANYKSLLKEVDGEKAARRVTVPTLVLMAEYDVVVGPWNTRAVFAALAAKEKELAVIPKSGHSMAGDVSGDVVLGHVDRWLARHLREDAP